MLWKEENLSSLKQNFPDQIEAARQNPLLTKRHLAAQQEFAQGHLKDSQTVKKTFLWSDETKIEMLGVNGGYHIWRKPMIFITWSNTGAAR